MPCFFRFVSCIRAKLRAMATETQTKSRFHRGMLPARAFAHVLVTDDHPRLAGLVVCLGDLGEGLDVTGELVLAVADLVVAAIGRVKALTAPRYRLPEMFSRWPRT